MNLPLVKNRLLDKEMEMREESSDTSNKVLTIHTDNNFERFNNNSNNSWRSRGNSAKGHRGRGYRRGGNHHQQNGSGDRNFSKNNGHSNKQKGECYFCGRPGHMIAECNYRKRYEDHQQKRNKNQANSANLLHDKKNDNVSSSYFMGMAGAQQTHNIGGIDFVIDSGASHHMIKDDTLFEDFVVLQPPIEIEIAKTGTFIYATKKGNIRIITNLEKTGILEEVLYSPEVPKNLLSVRTLQKAKIRTVFEDDGTIKLSRNGIPLMTGKSNSSLPSLSFNVSNAQIGRVFLNVCKSRKMHLRYLA